MNWPTLHDASLTEIQLQWKEGGVQIGVIFFASGADRRGSILGVGVSKFSCTREFPWGESESVNEISLNLEENSTALTIEMQSGDMIAVSAESFIFKND